MRSLKALSRSRDSLCIVIIRSWIARVVLRLLVATSSSSRWPIDSWHFETWSLIKDKFWVIFGSMIDFWRFSEASKPCKVWSSGYGFMSGSMSFEITSRWWRGVMSSLSYSFSLLWTVLRSLSIRSGSLACRSTTDLSITDLSITDLSITDLSDTDLSRLVEASLGLIDCS